jgi:sec-independent protein translocase protein TatC
MSLETIEVTEGIGTFMKISLMSGIALALPYIFFEAWLFAAPGLRPKEKKYGLIGIPFATLLFISGVVFTYFILPAAFGAIRQFNEYMGFVTKWTPNSYYTFVTNLMIWLGIFFEFPLVIYILTSMGLVKPKFLAEQWRLAVVIIAILAAAITPTVDPVNMGLVMAPMILLYFISIGLSHIAYAGRNQGGAGVSNQAGDEGTGQSAV